MRVSYDPKEDIMMLEASDKKVSHAEEMGPVIIHFTKDQEPVLLEILDASEVLTGLLQVAMKSRKREVVEFAI